MCTLFLSNIPALYNDDETAFLTIVRYSYHVITIIFIFKNKKRIISLSEYINNVFNMPIHFHYIKFVSCNSSRLQGYICCEIYII